MVAALADAQPLPSIVIPAPSVRAVAAVAKRGLFTS
jgi:hypothetical protein